MARLCEHRPPSLLLRLKILHAVLHLFRRINSVHKFQVRNPSTDVMNILLTKNDAAVLHPLYGQVNKIGIIVQKT